MGESRQPRDQNSECYDHEHDALAAKLRAEFEVIDVCAIDGMPNEAGDQQGQQEAYYVGSSYQQDKHVNPWA